MTHNEIEGLIRAGKVQSTSRNEHYQSSKTTEVLPDAHAEFINKYGALSCYGGYFRLLGISEHEDIRSWNDDATWKFSWKGRISDYICFGMDGFGSQYAYKKESDGRLASETIYLLDFASMQPLDIAKDFEQFLADEFLKNAIQPFDEQIIKSRELLGSLNIGQLVSFAPPAVLFEDPFPLCDQVILPATDTLIMNGDAACQYDEAQEGQVLSRISHRIDETGRKRLRIEFE
ncbi:SMI1/KNR4 family protein [uncultured Tateyamaria sp.]|uniref:SMI1/KNR4 family protein n=1 Tax=uncultured Tateyamaria sp. TaxID=455651 RepID=UPI002611982C|nr:SMI1/KNR4 family protein [uncultured Tateyamaria sp.]